MGRLPGAGNHKIDFLRTALHSGEDLFDRPAQALFGPVPGEPVGHADGVNPVLTGEQFRIPQQRAERLPVHASLHLGHRGFPRVLRGSCCARENFCGLVLVSSNHCQ